MKPVPGTDTRETSVEKELSFRRFLPMHTLGYLLATRILANGSIRILYPFLPAVARGLGVSLASASRLASMHGGMRMAAPLLGHLSDRYGRRRLMELSLLLLSVACAVVYFTDEYSLVLFAFAGIGLARAVFDPSVQAYVGDKVPYIARGRPFAILSMAWALSWLLGVPLAGLLIERRGWQAPWGFISVFLLAAVFVLRRFVPKTAGLGSAGTLYNSLNWWRLLRRRNLRTALLIGFCTVFAVENILIVYGAFLESRFALSVGTIGIVSIVIGGSELLAEGGSYLWTDRLGKRRSMLFGLTGFTLALLLLPFAGQHIGSALLGFAFVFFCFEFTIVSFFPLMSEVVPEARGTAISMNVASMGLARFLAPAVATYLFQWSGDLLPNALLSAAACVIAAALTGWVLWDHS